MYYLVVILYNYTNLSIHYTKDIATNMHGATIATAKISVSSKIFINII